MIKIIIDWDIVRKIIIKIVTIFIIRRAYIGYCLFLELEKVKPFSFSKFSRFEFYKIEICFRQYLSLYKGQNYNNAKICFKSVVFDSF
jgi:hypothetical protein